LDDQGSISGRGRDFSLPHHVKTGAGDYQASYQWVSWAFSPEVKWPGREADHSLPSSVEVKNAWI